ncbi:MAG TPA: MerR family transcriptional regulator [Blastocatellia bacterium]|nr:MerR family transcriptional regulator [Blastocatellia bacterium]
MLDMVDQDKNISSYSTTPKYRIGTVSRLTGLSADVVRVWERRYGAIRPERSEGGSRLYSEADIARLRRLRQAVELGHAIGQVAKLPESELENLSAKHRAPFSVQQDSSDSYEVIRERFLEAIGRMDVTAAEGEISRAAALYPPRVAIKNILSPLLAEIGERWAERDLGIAQEHAATNLIRNLLGSLFRLYPPDEAAETIVFATPAGERHEFGILLGALMAATRGWQVIYLGTDLPGIEIGRTAKVTKARVLVLGLATPDHARTVEELKALAEQLSSQTRVWVGGAEAAKHRDLIEQADWILIHDLEDLDDRLRR